MEKVKEEVKKQIECILEDGIKNENLDALYKLVDIHKDLANEEYWEKKEEMLMYRGYNGYNDGGYGGYGRGGNYNEGGSYGRRGVKGTGRGARRYRGEESIEDMHEMYRDYSAGREEYGRGNYGAKEDTMKSLDYMMQSVVEFIEMLKKDASSQEEVELIQQYTRQISEM